jgi:hypothetical protein
MGLFSRRASGATLPADIVDRVTTYIRFETNPEGSDVDQSTINESIYRPLRRFATRDPADFIEQLADAVLPVGGHAVRGGERLVADLIGGNCKDPNYYAMLDAALNWLRHCGATPAQLTGYEWGYWCYTYGADAW